MSKPRGLLELMRAVDAGLVAVDDDDSAKLAGHRRMTYGRTRQSAPAVETPPTSTDDASFEFSAAVSYSSASPASMVFSDGQLRAHQFPAVRSSTASSKVASPTRSSSMGHGGAKAGSGGSKKRISFKDDGAGRTAATKAGDQQRRKGGGLLGCMGSTCTFGSSSNEVVELGKNANRKVVAN
ncbi:hypothetical protein E2562_039444 [Oryza meyeriana var. granulata]|uniref:Uncharacterized protein n=1 Tax=Oryza meyeriana var. granulata TaxID=110450 RepID=A0A6G1EBU9_9ORYZ|nr:hypothetical protein E2562_039444 [Oryza meyeriana var. granulata]